MVAPEDPDPAFAPHPPAGDEPGRLQCDARLRYFLSLAPAEVVERVGAEAERLAAAEAALGRARRSLAAARTDAERRRAAEEVRLRTSSHFHPFSSGVYVPSKRWGKPSIVEGFGKENVFSVLIDSEAASSEIARSGVHVCSRAGDVTTGLATRAALLELGRSGVPGSARLARAWSPALGDVIGQAGIALAQHSPPPSGTPAGTYLGEGILIGVIDSWFDLHHPDFCDAAGDNPGEAERDHTPPVPRA